MILARRLAKNLKKRRGDLSQTAFAKHIKIDRKVYYRLETGEHNPTLATLEQLMNALKCKASDLLD